MELLALVQNQFIDILAYVTLGIIALYFLLFLIPLLFAINKRGELNKKEKNINLIFIQQNSVLEDILKSLNEKDIIIDISLKERLSKLNQSLVAKKGLVAKEEINDLKALEQELLGYLDEDDPKVTQYKAALLELVEIYRKDIASYNITVDAYNYWINFLIYRPLFKLFRFKKRDTIQ